VPGSKSRGTGNDEAVPEIAREIGNQQLEEGSCMTWGRWLAKGDLDEAEVYFRQVLALREELGQRLRKWITGCIIRR
jgi:hypothetical protein